MTALGWARSIVRFASRIVPRRLRSEWLREWDAELLHYTFDHEGERRGVVARSAGAVVDAAVLRTYAMQLDLLGNDIRYAWRNMIRRPAFTLLVVLTLALGIGVNSAVFALLDRVLLQPPPYRDSERLVFMWQTLPRLNVPEVEATAFDYDAWQRLQTIPEIAMLRYGSFSVTGNNDPERVKGARVTASLMPVLGIAPAIGRAFTPSEDGDDVPRVVILGDGLWRRRFGGDPSIIGRSIDIEGAPWTVVGVMPGGMRLPDTTSAESELWLPIRLSAAERINDQRHDFTFIGRLAPSVSLPQAAAEFEARAARLAAERPSHAGIGARLVPVAEQSVREVRPALLVAAVSVGLLLLVATANASTLLIARTSTRRSEFAVRSALGASRTRLLSQALVEGVMLALLGALVGLALGGWTLRPLIALFGPSLQTSAPVEIDSRTALFSAVLALAIGTWFGLIAAFRSGPAPGGALAGITRSTASRTAVRARHALVTCQVALAVVLLSAGGLMLSSVVKLARVSPGFDPDHALTFRLALSGGRYDSPNARAGFAADLVARLGTLPGVESVGMVSALPLGGSRNADGIAIEGRPTSASEPPIVIDQRYVTPDYFRAMRIPLVQGRSFTSADTAQTEPVVLINRAMARRYFSGSSAIGRHLKSTGPSTRWARIVGVVDDVRHISLSRDPVPEMYHPFAQIPADAFSVVIRTRGEPAALAPSARAAVIATDPNLPTYEVQTMSERIAGSLAQARGTMLVLLVTALLATSLAAVAIYGSIWYAVVQQQKEIGIRMALGASRASVFRGIVGGAVVRAAVGAAAGTTIALLGGRLLRTMLFDTRTSDPLTHLAVVTGVLALTAVASMAPARRAISVDPMTALRNE